MSRYGFQPVILFNTLAVGGSDAHSNRVATFCADQPCFFKSKIPGPIPKSLADLTPAYRTWWLDSAPPPLPGVDAAGTNVCFFGASSASTAAIWQTEVRLTNKTTKRQERMAKSFIVQLLEIATPVAHRFFRGAVIPVKKQTIRTPYSRRASHDGARSRELRYPKSRW